MAATHSPPEILSDWSAIRVTGSDRVSFLQGQLTQDVATVLPDQPRLAGWASAKGRLLCTTWLCDWNDALFLLLPAELAADVTRRLQMFVLRADVQLEISPNTVSLIRDFSDDKKLINNCYYNDNRFDFAVTNDWGLQLRAAGTEDPPAGDDAGDTASEKLRSLCIAAGLPVITTPTREAFVPQMVNLDLLDGISFSKGCYVGQEIVARTQNLGRIKRRMFRFQCAQTDVSAGDPVMNGGQAAGTVVDAVTTDTGCELLAVIKLDQLGGALTLAGDVSLTHAPLPYPVPEQAGH
ncbi:MAG: folate-binding protein YgfZ [Gammaproteobacteria bacterium]|nr:folate-binding protein YgfZ [Gammaproteobacteria bacterium]